MMYHSRPESRRTFLRATSLAGASVITPWQSVLDHLGAVSAQEAAVPNQLVSMESQVAHWVKILEETPRNALLDKVAGAIKKGRVTYRELLSSLFLAAVKHVQPRPSVGFKFHAVLVVHSAHLASLNSSPQDRWLPILWAIDQFKSSQTRDIQEGDWTMSAVDESSVPAPHRVLTEFDDAMSRWDESKADGCAAGLARFATRNQAFECFATFAARDYRSIGHKVIYVANAFRTLDVIGWHYAEPILRSLAYALLNHVGESNPASSDHSVDQPWKANQRMAKELPENWVEGRTDVDLTREVVTGLREWNPTEAGARVGQLLKRDASLQCIVDGLYLAGSELLMRQPGIVSLHSLTTTNAVQYLARTVQNDLLRKQLILQNASFLPFFLDSMRGRGAVKDRLQPLTNEVGEDAAITAADVFKRLGENSADAYLQARLLLQRDPNALSEYMSEARRLIFLKGNDSHDYKYSSAILEDLVQLSPMWRADFAAACLYKLRSTQEPTTDLVHRIQQALA
jgi:hypothetical protein